MNLRFLLVAALAAPAAFAAEAPADAGPKTFSTTLDAGKIHEECLHLDKGRKRAYEWKADTAVDFNIHYHEGKEVFYPVKKERQRLGKGTFRAKVAQDYCWMWTAKVQTKIDGSIK
jgi:hypothetical protein